MTRPARSTSLAIEAAVSQSIASGFDQERDLPLDGIALDCPVRSRGHADEQRLGLRLVEERVVVLEGGDAEPPRERRCTRRRPARDADDSYVAKGEERVQVSLGDAAGPDDCDAQQLAHDAPPSSNASTVWSASFGFSSMSAKSAGASLKGFT